MRHTRPAPNAFGMLVCPHCGKRFQPNIGKQGRPNGRQRFCTYACCTASYEANRRAKEPPEKKERRHALVTKWKREHRAKVKAFNDKYTATMRDYYIRHLLRQSGKEPTPENIAMKKALLKIKRKMRAANKRRRGW